MSIIGNAVTFGGGSGEPELLWTNPNPGTYFGAQEVTLPTGYSAYLVEFMYMFSDGRRSIMYLPMGGSLRYAFSHLHTGQISNWYTRRINSVADGAISFGTGVGPNGTFSTHNDYAVPTRIWGVKWTI